ncbi:MAG: FtsX-like permease family protein [Myxococcales bacterium FL481]|nr:MAG: FtsX-like permease family protein [Myxococcales bacterium FL481]
MLNYAWTNTVRSLRQRIGLSTLVVATIAIGLGLLMTVRTMGYNDSRDPVPGRGNQLHAVQFDTRPLSDSTDFDIVRSGELPYLDAANLVALETPATAQVMLWSIFGIISDADDNELEPLDVLGTATTGNMFETFNLRFEFGGAWEPGSDARPEAVAVIDHRTNGYLFGGVDSIGRQLRLNETMVTVVGVLAQTQRQRRFYDGSFEQGHPSHIFVPHGLARQENFGRLGRTACVPYEESEGVTVNDEAAMECSWVSFWTWLESPEAISGYREVIANYVLEQKKVGRLPRENVAHVTSLHGRHQLLEERYSRHSLFNAIATMFFLVCLVNAMGILLAKFMARTKEMSLRRALGATRAAIVLEHLLEVACLGIIAGTLGIGLAYLGLRGMIKVELYARDYTVTAESIQTFFELDMTMMLVAAGVSLVSGLLIGLYPIWRVCQVPPGSQLRSQ